MDQWTSMSQRWEEWGPPLRPSNEDVELIRSQMIPGRVLLLGATPELLSLASVAVDSSIEALKTHKADKADKAVSGNWRKLPFPDKTFDTVIGDGSLNVFEGDPSQFFNEMRRVCDKLVLRVFIAPTIRESLDQVFDFKSGCNFHALKWRVAHSLANPYVSVRDIYDEFEMDWCHPTLEVYRDSKAVYYFPKLTDLPEWSELRFPSTYELAERCPIITWMF